MVDTLGFILPNFSICLLFCVHSFKKIRNESIDPKSHKFLLRGEIYLAYHPVLPHMVCILAVLLGWLVEIWTST